MNLLERFGEYNMHYYSFLNKMCKLRPIDFKLLSAKVPGNITDPKYKKSTTFTKQTRFNRWYKLPNSACKLYWRTHRD